MKKIILFLLFICLTLPSLAACVDASRQPKTTSDYLPGVYKVEFWSEYDFYEFGEPINLRATLTNVSTDTITFKGKSGTTPILDINLRTPGGVGPEERTWSKENSNRVEYSITLAPQESYTITWTLALSFQTTYGVGVLWIDPREGRQFTKGTGIAHGNRLPMP